ncbi:hypothetical protein, partial [Campylobacter coli]
MTYKMRGKVTRKKHVKRSKGRKKVPNNKNLARRVKKLEHSEELKYVDYYDTTALTTTGFLIPLSITAQGDDFNQRVGEEVTAKYMNMKLKYGKTTASINSQIYRFIVFWDLQTNGVGPTQLTSTSLITGVLDNGTITDALISPHNYRTRERYHILYDKLHHVNAQSSSM